MGSVKLLEIGMLVVFIGACGGMGDIEVSSEQSDNYLEEGNGVCYPPCDDSNPCTDDFCAVGGCVHLTTPKWTPCEDDGPDTVGGHCDNRVCVGHYLRDCDPLTCGEKECGIWSDGCGGSLDCGRCARYHGCNEFGQCEFTGCIANFEPCDPSFGLCCNGTCCACKCGKIIGICEVGSVGCGPTCQEACDQY